MFAVGGFLLMVAGFIIGVPGEISSNGFTFGQVLVIGGSAFLTWELLNQFKKFLDLFPLAIGIATIGIFGIYGREMWGIVGGVAILTACAWNAIKARKKRR